MNDVGSTRSKTREKCCAREGLRHSSGKFGEKVCKAVVVLKIKRNLEEIYPKRSEVGCVPPNVLAWAQLFKTRLTLTRD